MADMVLDNQAATPGMVQTDIHPGVVGESLVITISAAAVTVAIGELMSNQSQIVIGHNAILPNRSGTILGAEPLVPGELDFWFQKQAFEMIPKDQLTQYCGKFVASRDGAVVESATELEDLTERFFSRYGDVPVYVTRIGEDFEVRIDTPFFD